MSKTGRLLWSGRRMRVACCKHPGKTVAAIVLLLWLSGMTDHFFTTSYAEFSWPPHIHLRAKVEEVIRAGRPVSDTPNVWNRSVEVVPSCVTGAYKDADPTHRLLVIVKSAVGNFEARNAIRSTWGTEQSENEWGIRFVFVLGASQDRSIMNRVMRESDNYHDILLSTDFVDEYYNNGKKFGLSLWLTTVSPLAAGCPSAFTLLIDDDYMVNRANLIHLLSGRRGDEPLYEGWRMDSAPFRFRLHKHRVSLADYPFDAYPPYITAGAVLLSAHSAERFYYGSLFLKLYAFDDVYAGILAKQLSIQPDHNDAFLYWSSARANIDWSKTIAAHGFAPSDINGQFPPTPTKPRFMG
ncbi:hypothetical protein PFISCL1PPCAC_22613 [Pristionchus fissidentatus]|uniref:Hexosyltransferase n=1 Tax=Pristionchus fissidentatus TaxID=1538716 RepID=A0AAV5WHB1_9BILA|nr:hypothetical protein PFISCL1PPCAC_22613 [Pristionchus fissidentatus]